MGFIVRYAPRLTIVISVLIVALREICLELFDMVGFCGEPSCSTGIMTGDTDFMSDSDMGTLRNPSWTEDCTGSGALPSKWRPSLVSLVYEGVEECAREVNLRCQGKRQELAAGASMECSVCLCELEQGQLLHITPQCCHVFHSDCIYKWLDQDQRTCPLCRTSLAALHHLSTSSARDE